MEAWILRSEIVHKGRERSLVLKFTCCLERGNSLQLGNPKDHPVPHMIHAKKKI